MRKMAIIFALFYLMSSVGYGLKVHFCLGRISDVNYVLLDTSCPCDESHAATLSMECCEEKSFFNQIEEEHSSPASVSLAHHQLPLMAELPYALRQWKNVQELQSKDIVERGPPKTRDLTIELQRLITYG